MDRCRQNEECLVSESTVVVNLYVIEADEVGEKYLQ